MIKTRSIYSEGSEDDGVRALVTRYWPRGVGKDAIDRWLRDLGPAPELIKLWKSGKIDWDRFRKDYLDEYKSLDKSALLKELKDFIKGSREKDVTLLCTCRIEERCHRDILKELLKK